MKNIKLYRATACLLVAALLCTGSTVLAFNTVTPKAENDTVITEENSSEAETTPAAEKDETVYVLAGADGSVERIIVSDWIKNNTASPELTDVGTLPDVKNVRGDESYVMNSDNMRVWDAQSGDIYCRGDSTLALPVGISVSYRLDGVTVSPDELAGKSGHVTIRFDYTNRLGETVMINGKEENIYVPFLMMTGMILGNSKFTDIEVTNGRLINDGSRCVVCGIALPGLQEDLALDSEDISIPDYVEISADVTDFELETTLTLATNEIFSGIDTSSAEDAATELKESVSAMTGAVSQLIDGSSQLYSGLSTLLSKTDDLTNAVDSLASGAVELNNGSQTLADSCSAFAAATLDASKGASSLADGTVQLADGVGKLSDGASELAGYTSSVNDGTQMLFAGLNEISSNSQLLRNGATNVFNSMLANVNSSLTAAGLSVPELTIDNYAASLDALSSTISDENVEAQALSQIRASITKTVTDATRLGILSGIMQSIGLTADDYNNLDPETKSQIDAQTEAQMSSEGVINSINTTVETSLASQEVRSQIDAAVSAAGAGRAQIDAAKQQLLAYHEFYNAINSYTAGVDSAANSEDSLKLKAGISSVNSGMQMLAYGDGVTSLGAAGAASGAKTVSDGASSLSEGTSKINTAANQISDGASTLNSGMATLKGGLVQLQTATPALKSGVIQLADGARQLSDGLAQFNDEAILRLAELSGDADSILQRIKALVSVSGDYQSYSGLAENTDGRVRFIFKTEGIND